MAEVIDTGAPVFRGRKLRLVALVCAVIGFVLLAIGVAVNPARTWLSYLMAFAFAFTTVVGALFWQMIAYATNARWMSVIRRPIEAVVSPLPALALLFVPLLFGLQWLYPWHTPAAGTAEHELHIYEHRAAYLNTTFFVIRAVLYFLVLLIAAYLLRRWSLRRDRVAEVVDADPLEALGRERRFSSGMLPPVGLAFTFAAVDWLMALNGVWYSTMYPVIVFAGGFLTSIAVITILAERISRHHGPAGVLTPNHFHALGRLMFAFVVFWTYTQFFQAMLMRIANKPEEVTFYLARTGGAWGVFVWILIIGHFVLPFLVLMPKAVKFRPRAMALAAGWLVLMHLFDIYWQVIPSRVQGVLVFHWLDLGALAAVVGTCVAVAAWRHEGVSLVAKRDPFLPTGAVYRSPL